MVVSCQPVVLTILMFLMADPYASLAEEPGLKPLTERSRVYKKVDGRELRLDMTQPGDWGSDVKDRPAVVFFHGGGWTGGAPGQFSEHSTELARRGMVCFRVEYRLLDKKEKDPPTICVEDVSDAFRFIRARASEFGIDPNRIAAGGGSAGGHLAAFLGMMDDEVVDGVSRKPNALLLFNPCTTTDLVDGERNAWAMPISSTHQRKTSLQMTRLRSFSLAPKTS